MSKYDKHHTVTLRNASAENRATMLTCVDRYETDFADRRATPGRQSVVGYTVGPEADGPMVWLWWTKRGIVARWQDAPKEGES